MYSLQGFSVYDIDVDMFDGIQCKHNVYRDKDITMGENYTVTKWSKGIIWKDKNQLHFQKKFKHKYTNDENYQKS